MARTGGRAPPGWTGSARGGRFLPLLSGAVGVLVAVAGLVMLGVVLGGDEVSTPVTLVTLYVGSVLLAFAVGLRPGISSGRPEQVERRTPSGVSEPGLAFPWSRSRMLAIAWALAGAAVLCFWMWDHAAEDAPVVSIIGLLTGGALGVVVAFGVRGVVLGKRLVVTPRRLRFETGPSAAEVAWEQVAFVAAAEVETNGAKVRYLGLALHHRDGVVGPWLAVRGVTWLESTTGLRVAVPANNLAVDPVLAHDVLVRLHEHPENRGLLPALPVDPR